MSYRINIYINVLSRIDQSQYTKLIFYICIVQYFKTKTPYKVYLYTLPEKSMLFLTIIPCDKQDTWTPVGGNLFSSRWSLFKYVVIKQSGPTDLTTAKQN